MLNFEGYGVLPEYDQPNEGDIVTRQSDMSSMMLSPHRVGMRDMEGYAHTPSEPMFFGTLAHDAIERFIRGEAEFLELTVTQSIVERAFALAENGSHENDTGFDLLSVTSTAYLEQMAAEVRNAFLSWHSTFWEEEGKHLDVAFLEERLVRPLGTLPDGRGVWVVGTPDFGAYRDGILTVVDWKTTGSRDWWEKALTTPQVPIYTWLLQSRFDIDLDVEELPWIFLVYHRKDGAWKRYELTEESGYPVTTAYVEATMRNLWQYARCIAFECYPAINHVTAGFSKQPRAWYARPDYNPGWNIDPFKHMLDDYDESEMVTSEW